MFKVSLFGDGNEIVIRVEMVDKEDITLYSVETRKQCAIASFCNIVVLQGGQVVNLYERLDQEPFVEEPEDTFEEVDESEDLVENVNELSAIPPMDTSI